MCDFDEDFLHCASYEYILLPKAESIFISHTVQSIEIDSFDYPIPGYDQYYYACLKTSTRYAFLPLALRIVKRIISFPTCNRINNYFHHQRSYTATQPKNNYSTIYEGCPKFPNTGGTPGSCAVENHISASDLLLSSCVSSASNFSATIVLSVSLLQHLFDDLFLSKHFMQTLNKM